MPDDSACLLVTCIAVSQVVHTAYAGQQTEQQLASYLASSVPTNQNLCLHHHHQRLKKKLSKQDWHLQILMCVKTEDDDEYCTYVRSRLMRLIAIRTARNKLWTRSIYPPISSYLSPCYMLQCNDLRIDSCGVRCMPAQARNPARATSFMTNCIARTLPHRLPRAPAHIGS